MLTAPHRLGGYTLIELMVALGIVGMLLVVSVPSFAEWVSNAKVRSVAEEVANGLRMAQAEAMRRNRVAVFVTTTSTPTLSATPTSNGTNWYVQTLPLVGGASQTATSTDFVQGSNYGTASATTLSTTSSVVCFGPLGSQTSVEATATNNVLSVACSSGSKTYTISRTGADRSLKVMLSVGGQIRLCDPTKTLSTSNPDGCPA